MTKSISLIVAIFFVFEARAVKYRTYFGECPSRFTGKFVLMLVKDFEKNRSLKYMKELILKDNLKDRYYLSSYKISYDPLIKLLSFSFKCPKPLIKVQIYKNMGTEAYSGVLVDNGQLFDPNYLILLRSEGLLKTELASLALPLGKLDHDDQNKMTKLLKNIDGNLKNILSEAIIDEESDLTLIFSIKNRPSSVFLGRDNWSVKVKKLQRILSYMGENNKTPSIINITDDKKIVVKFSNKL